VSLPNVPPRAGRGRSPLRALLRGLLLAALVAYFGFAGMVLALRYLVLPNVDTYRGQFEELVSSSVGRPVRIGSLVADWSGLRPRLHLRQLVLMDDAGQPALELAQVDAVMGWSSLLRLRPYFHHIELQGPRLVVRREADGRMYVAGMAVEAESNEPGFADWLLAQGSIVVRDARLEWTDVQRGAPTLVLEQVGLVLKNWLGHHRFGLQARPPAALATAIDVRGDLLGHDPQRLADWRGQVYARVDEADLGGFQTWVDLPYEAAGRGSARAWGELTAGNLTALTADLKLADAKARLAPQLPPLELSAASGRVRLAQSAAALSVELAGFSLATRQGVSVPATDLRLEQRLGEKPGGSFRANLLDLEALTRLTAHLPLAQEVVDRLAAFDPAGRIRKPELEWTGPPEAITAWKLKAGFDGIGLRAWKSIPGVSGLSGEMEGSNAVGRLRIGSRDVAVDLPGVFSNPRLQLANVRAECGWERRGGDLTFSLDKAEFDNQDASGQASGTYRPSTTGPGVIDLQARLTRANGAAVWRYMPLVVNSDTRDWLQRGIVGGTAHDARLRLKGDLKDFPFVDGKGGGQFQVRARIAGARLDYAEGWPAIDAIDGELLFEGASMKVSAERGRIFGVQLAGVTAVLPNLEAADQTLTIRGRAAGPTRDFLRFIAVSPVAAQIDHFTDDMSAEGNGNLDLELVMPLEHVEHTKVKGEFRFAGNRMVVVPALPPVTEAAGRISFTGTTLTVPEARGKLFGEPVQISGRTGADGAVLFEASGGVTPAAARQHWESPLFAHLSGLTAWRSSIQVRGRGATVVVESNLKGFASSLPLPFNKSAAEEWPLRVEMDLQPADAGDRIRATLRDVAAMELLGRSGTEAWRVTRGAIAVHQPAKLPDKGLSFHATLPELDVDAWRRIGRQAGVVTAAPQRGGAVDLSDVSVQAGKVVAIGETLHDFSLQATARTDGWQGSLKSREAEGDFRWTSKDEGALTARLSRVVMSGGKEGIGPEESGGSASTDSLPALDVTVQQFVVGDKALGRLAVQARNEGGAWHLDSISLGNPDGGLSGKGLWQPGRNGHTDMDFKLDTGDVGRFLARLGFPGAIRGGKATLEGKLRWSGPPTAIDYPSLSGKMDLEAGNGQFQKLDPGVGRLLGVLNLQSLPRRITLDFRDVFSEGFAFDRISGSIDVKAGVMRTSDLTIRGPAARVTLVGSADVARETQDLLVKIQPTLSESLAVGAAVTLVNPVAGVVTYLAQKAMSDPIEKLFAFEYHVTGQWQDPKVEKVSTPPPVGSAEK
jgi:uncharacterized protein (TIGR02099 family)